MAVPGLGPRTLVAGVAVCAACGVLYAWSIFMIPLEAAFDWTRGQTSFTFTLMIIAFSLGMFAGGILVEKRGPRFTALAGGLCLASGLALAAELPTLWGLYLCYGILGGFGIGMANLVPMTVCLRWYPQRKGLVGGVLALALALGTLIFGTLGAGRLLEVVGVHATWRIQAATLLSVIALGACFLRFPEGTMTRGKTDGNSQNATKAGQGASLGEMLRSSAYWKVWSWMFCVQTGGLMIIGHIVPYGLESGLSAGQAAAMMAAYAVANGLGRPLFGMAHDRFGPSTALALDALCMFIGLLLLLVLPAMTGFFGLLAAAMLVALAYGGTIPQLAALILALFGPRHFGVNYGFSTTPLMAASLCGPFLGGLLRTTFGSYGPSLGAALCITLLALYPAWGLRKNAV